MASRVPSIAQVRPGAAASIILKQDQPTGRQVQGVVQDVLTRGNHPRGIKVRLQDGRIGRVQRMVAGGDGSSFSGPAATTTTTTPASLQADLQNQQRARNGGGNGRQYSYRSERLGIRYTDVREDDGGGEPEAEMDLMAFVKQAKPKKGKKGKAMAATTATTDTTTDTASASAAAAEAETTGGKNAGADGQVDDGPVVDAEGRRGRGSGAVCPVCNEFEGDEAAVAYHVESHFK